MKMSLKGFDGYVGGKKNRARFGLGRQVFPDGSVYEGKWSWNKPHGRGVFRYANGDVYEGEFFKGKKHGRGVLNTLNGEVYDGNFVEDRFDGLGLSDYASDDEDARHWVYGNENGQASFTLSDRRSHTRQLAHVGQNDSAEGNLNGDLHRGKKNGHGVLKSPNGDIYEGNFVEDQFDGLGVLKYASGDEYGGAWVQAKCMGKVS